SVNIGVAAHIAAASSGGPRYDCKMSADTRGSIANGIWLCQDCAKLVDSDEDRFTAEILSEWKVVAEASIRKQLEGQHSHSPESPELLEKIDTLVIASQY